MLDDTAHSARRFGARRSGARRIPLGIARTLLSAAALALPGLGTLLTSSDADACGGFFCGRQPVDQTAERILFEVGQDSVTMTTQISFSGRAEDFAWVLPLSEVPALESLAVFSQKALTALDGNSGPVFNPPDDPACYNNLRYPVANAASPTADDDEAAPPPVTVYIRAEVGPYDAAVVGSEDPTELVRWLREAGYRITPAMEPYVARYTEEGMKFLALKLQDTAEVKDLKPFRFTLPGTAPSVPLRMTALAAEPEMSIVVFVLGERRFEGKNWANVEVPDDRIRYNPFLNPYASSVSTNWPQLVAKAVDEAGGQGWVTEFAGASDDYATQVRNQVQNDNFGTDEDREAARALLTALEAHPYLTRLYTRVSAEEMVSDPVFGQSSLGDVDRQHQLSRIVDGIDQCPEDLRQSTNPCDFTTCGAAGLCRPVPASSMPGASQAPDSSAAPIAGCACWAGATARVTFAPDGSPTVICQDGRLSFLNPGDREDDTLEVLPDPCASFSCGPNGQCISMNLTPTCVCDQGYVAVGNASDDGTRSMSCAKPTELVPAAFYANTLPALPAALPGGREVVLTEPQPMASPDVPPEPVTGADFPMPRSNPELGASQVPVGSRKNQGNCSLSASGAGLSGWSWLAALTGLGALGVRRRRAR